MKHPFSIALIGILAVLGMVLVCLFMFQALNQAVIPSDWRNTTNNTDEISAQNNGDETPDITEGIVSTSGNMIVTSPVAQQTIGLPLVMTGSARVFENALNYRLLDVDGAELVAGYAVADAFDTGEFGSFTVTTSYSEPKGAVGTLEVFDYSAKDGAVIDLVSIPVVFPSIESMIVKTYWTTAETSGLCSSVAVTERRVPQSPAVGYTALTELLAGPNTPESMAQFSTSIPESVSIKSLTIVDGVAKVEFSKSLETGGSCRVTAIRAQIESTLKQFPTVTSVILTTEGRSPAESLQP